VVVRRPNENLTGVSLVLESSARIGQARPWGVRRREAGGTGLMRRRFATLAFAGALLIGVASPAAAAPSRPTATMTRSAGCDSIQYDWSRIRKGSSATIALYHNGIFRAQETLSPVGESGSWKIPPQLVTIIIPGEHYTVFGTVQDAAGRTITTSGAAWWGFC
jgi:hypothetical protein